MAAAWLCGVALVAGLVGCGSNFPELLYQSASAAGRTYLDLLLTDVANTVADALDREDEVSPDGDDNGDDNGDDDGGDGGDISFDDLTGDPAAGEPLYASCAASRS